MGKFKSIVVLATMLVLAGVGSVWSAGTATRIYTFTQVGNEEHGNHGGERRRTFTGPGRIDIRLIGGGGGGQGSDAPDNWLGTNRDGRGGGGGSGALVNATITTRQNSTELRDIRVGYGGGGGARNRTNSNRTGHNGHTGGHSAITIDGRRIYADGGQGGHGHDRDRLGGSGGGRRITGGALPNTDQLTVTTNGEDGRNGREGSSNSTLGYGGYGHYDFGAGGRGGTPRYDPGSGGGSGRVIIRFTPLHTVHFNSNGGSAFNVREVWNREHLTNPGAPTRSGWSFEGWFRDDNGQRVFDYNGNGTLRYVEGNVGLHARWSQYTFNFNLNGGSGVSNTTRTRRDGVFTLPTPNRNGYIFYGWHDNSGLSGNRITQITPTANTRTLTFWARWQRIPETRAPITLELNQFPRNGGEVTVSWTTENPNTRGGHFWVYRRTNNAGN